MGSTIFAMKCGHRGKWKAFRVTSFLIRITCTIFDAYIKHALEKVFYFFVVNHAHGDLRWYNTTEKRMKDATFVSTSQRLLRLSNISNETMVPWVSFPDLIFCKVCQSCSYRKQDQDPTWFLKFDHNCNVHPISQNPFIIAPRRNAKKFYDKKEKSQVPAVVPKPKKEKKDKHKKEKKVKKWVFTSKWPMTTYVIWVAVFPQCCTRSIAVSPLSVPTTDSHIHTFDVGPNLKQSYVWLGLSVDEGTGWMPT